MRAAASSMPSGSPSSASQISVTAVAVSGSRSPKSGRTARARSTNSVTASDVSPPSSASGVTASTVSPATASALARRGEDLDRRTATEDRGDRRSGRGQDVLTVVDHHEELTTASASATVSMSAASPCGVMPEHGGEGRRDRRRVTDRGQLDHPDAVGELAGELGADLERQPGLADAARHRSA